MSITKKLPQSTPSPTQVRSDREAVRPEARGDLADRKVRVVEEDDRRSLGVRKLSQRGEEVRVAISVQMLDGSVWSGIFHAARLQRPGRDPKRGPPGPGDGVTHGLAAAEELGEGLGYRITRDLGVAREGVNGAPQPLGVGPVHGLDALAGFQSHNCAFHQ